MLHLIVIRAEGSMTFKLPFFYILLTSPRMRSPWHPSTLYRTGYWQLTKITRQHLECVWEFK